MGNLETFYLFHKLSCTFTTMWRLAYCNFSCIWMQDSKNFGWEINGDINFNWKTLLENKVGKKQTLATRS
jgi:hypothetical protein